MNKQRKKQKEKILDRYYNEMINFIKYCWEECCEEQTIENLYFEVQRNPFIPTLENIGYDHEFLYLVLEEDYLISPYDLSFKFVNNIIKEFEAEILGSKL